MNSLLILQVIFFMQKQQTFAQILKYEHVFLCFLLNHRKLNIFELQTVRTYEVSTSE